MRIEALGVEPPTETASEEANVEDVEVTIEPGFNIADLESAEASEEDQVVSDIIEEVVESMEVEPTLAAPNPPHKEPVDGGAKEGGWPPA